MTSTVPRPRRGWYVVDYETIHVLRGPFKTAEAAGAVRAEIERRMSEDDDRNLWIVDDQTLSNWEEEIARVNALAGEDAVLPRADLTVRRARDRLAGLHFAQESLSEGERAILFVAEALLRHCDALLAEVERARVGYASLFRHYQADVSQQTGRAESAEAEAARPTAERDYLLDSVRMYREFARRADELVDVLAAAAGSPAEGDDDHIGQFDGTLADGLAEDKT